MVHVVNFSYLALHKIKMENIKLFLETSTIHGLQYLSTVRKFDRVVWTFVVAFAFLMAGLLIHQSFYNWSENPITTTIETLPIDKVKLPKITICPPKGSYTNLNYDVMIADDISSLSNESQKEILNQFLMEMHQLDFEKAYSLLFKGPDQFLNWYKGLSLVEYQSFSYSNTRQIFSTSASNGTIQTPHFREDFKDENFPTIALYKMRFSIPKEMTRNVNISILLEIDFDMNEEYEVISLNYGDLELGTNPMKIKYQFSSNNEVVLAFERRFSIIREIQNF